MEKQSFLQRFFQKANDLYDFLDAKEVISLCDNYQDRKEPTLENQTLHFSADEFASPTDRLVAVG